MKKNIIKSTEEEFEYHDLDRLSRICKFFHGDMGVVNKV